MNDFDKIKINKDRSEFLFYVIVTDQEPKAIFSANDKLLQAAGEYLISEGIVNKLPEYETVGDDAMFYKLTSRGKEYAAYLAETGRMSVGVGPLKEKQ